MSEQPTGSGPQAYTPEEIQPLAVHEYGPLFERVQNRTLTAEEALPLVPRLMSTLDHLVDGMQQQRTMMEEVGDYVEALARDMEGHMVTLDNVINLLERLSQRMERATDSTTLANMVSSLRSMHGRIQERVKQIKGEEPEQQEKPTLIVVGGT